MRLKGIGAFLAYTGSNLVHVSNAPCNMKWSLDHSGRCGIPAFLRPCQTLAEVPANPDDFPLHRVCQAPREQVFVVDDDPTFVEVMLETLEMYGYQATGCHSSQEFKVASENATGCVLLDINLPGQDGIAIHKWIVVNELPLSVVYLSGTGDVGTVAHCMKAGAIEFLAKPFQPIALRNALRHGIGTARKMHCRLRSRSLVRELVQTLTPTELDVARMIARGLPTKSIATEMARSENTAKIHRHRIFSKLMVNSTASVANIMRMFEEGQVSAAPAEH